MKPWKPTELVQRITAAGFAITTRDLLEIRKAAGMTGRTVDLAALLGHLLDARTPAALEVRAEWPPGELMDAINAAGFGPVTNRRQFLYIRQSAGMTGRTVDLAALLGHLLANRPEAEGDRYEKAKAKAAERSRQQSAAGRDIGQIPECKNPERRQHAAEDLAWGLKAYFPDTFDLPWSEDHLRIIKRMETIAKNGGLLALAMPRGSGKSTISSAVALLAAFYGWRSYIVLIGAEKEAAEEMLNDIKISIEENDQLAEDFPEVVYPIRQLEGIANRCSGQLHNGKRTHIRWTQTEIVLPTIEGSAASGAIIRVAGILGRIRGMKSTLPDGRTVRPDFVIPDDPQTDESAVSAQQCDKREAVIAGAVLGLAGPGKKIAGVMPCTIIKPGDLSDRILDRKKNPEWNGETTRMVYQFPTTEAAKAHWKKYKKIREEGLRRGDDGRAGNEYYRKNRAAMDEGAIVGWEHRKDPEDVSALQHAYNLLFRNPAVFWSEYQNSPQQAEGTERQLKGDDLAERLNGMPRAIIPTPAAHLTAYVDVQLTVLFWGVVAWSDDFTGDVVAYGCFPDQGRPFFTVKETQNTLEHRYGKGEEGNILAGLLDLTTALAEREWQRDDGTIATIDQILIDADWKRDVVYQLWRKSPHRGLILPAYSKFIGPQHRPMDEWNRKPGDRFGLNWTIPARTHQRSVRHVSYDVNWWKSFVLKRLMTAPGNAGALQIFGEDIKEHSLLSHHLTCEFYERTQGRGRTVDLWDKRPGLSENHYWDCLVGAAVGASINGAKLAAVEDTEQPKKRRVKLSELQRQKRRARG